MKSTVGDLFGCSSLPGRASGTQALSILLQLHRYYVASQVVGEGQLGGTLTSGQFYGLGLGVEHTLTP